MIDKLDQLEEDDFDVSGLSLSKKKWLIVYYLSYYWLFSVMHEMAFVIAPICFIITLCLI